MLGNCPQWNIENVTGLVVALTALAVIGPHIGATFTNGAQK